MAGICRILAHRIPRNVNVISPKYCQNHVSYKSAIASTKLVEENEEKVVHAAVVSQQSTTSSAANIHDIQHHGGHGHPVFSKLEFMDAEEAYRSKTTWEIFRGLFVLKMCQFDSLVTYNKEVG